MAIGFQETGAGIEGAATFQSDTTPNPLTGHAPQQTFGYARDSGGSVFDSFLLQVNAASTANQYQCKYNPSFVNITTIPAQGPVLIAPTTSESLNSGGPLITLPDGSVVVTVPYVVLITTTPQMLGGIVKLETSYSIFSTSMNNPGASFLTIKMVDPLTSIIYEVVPRHDESPLGIRRYTVNTAAFTSSPVVQIQLIHELTLNAIDTVFGKSPFAGLYLGYGH